MGVAGSTPQVPAGYVVWMVAVHGPRINVPVPTRTHFPSDVLFGAAGGCFVARFILERGVIAKCFDQWEAQWRAS